MAINDKVLIIIRGLPGSGKSTLAENLSYALGIECKVSWYEADNYFIRPVGLGIYEYRFNKEDLPAAHRDCYNKVKEALEHNTPTVIVSNTSVSRGEYMRYIDLARQYDYKIQVLDVHGELENVHNVPQETLDRMEERWEPFDRSLLAI